MQLVNRSKLRFCERCGSPMSLEVVIELGSRRSVSDDLMLALVNDSKVWKMLRKRRIKIGFGKKLQGIFASGIK